MNPKIDLPQTLRWEGGELYLLDQTLLPGKVVEERQDSVEQNRSGIRSRNSKSEERLQSV